MTSSTSFPTRTLGTTKLDVTPLSIGCAPLGNMVDTFKYSVDEERALSTLRAAFNSPINFIDTAASYGDGESERRIGIVLKELGSLPNGYVLATKADRNLQTNDFSGDQIKCSVERSLHLLGLDRLQLVYLHDPEYTTFESAMAKGGPVEVLQQFKEQGTIEHVGVAGGPVKLMQRYVDTDAFEVLITHNRYTLLNRSADVLITRASKRGVAVVNAAPYGSGILAKGPDAYARYAYQDAPKKMVARTRRINEICQRYNVPLTAAALQFSLRDPRIASTIVGISRPERLEQTLALAKHPILDNLWTDIDAIGYETKDLKAGRWG